MAEFDVVRGPGCGTTDERELAGILEVRYDDVVRALGTGWRKVRPGGVGRTWFISGVPAQVAVGVSEGSVVIAPPNVDFDAAGYGDGGRSFSRDDLLSMPDWVATTADEYARARRRTFRWCPTCRESCAPEDFLGYRGVCRACGVRHHGLEQ